MGLGTQGGPTALQLRDGVGPAMKPEMGMWLATAAGNNGLFHCSTFFPLHFVSKYCVFQGKKRNEIVSAPYLSVCNDCTFYII